MKPILLAYALAMALLLALRPAPTVQGPECGAGVLCIRTQQQARAALR